MAVPNAIVRRHYRPTAVRHISEKPTFATLEKKGDLNVIGMRDGSQAKVGNPAACEVEFPNEPSAAVSMRGFDGLVSQPRKASRGVCYCKDCQAFARYLGNPDTVLDNMGGTDVVATLV